MKLYIIMGAVIVLFSFFMVFQTDNDIYINYQTQLKTTVDDAANAASLYYESASYGEGETVFNKSDGNQVIADILYKKWNTDDTLIIDHTCISGPLNYMVYYFDETGICQTYRNGEFLQSEAITFPYMFRENLTGFEKIVTKATVIVTADIGNYDFRLGFIDDPLLIRTSAYEVVPY